MVTVRSITLLLTAGVLLSGCSSLSYKQSMSTIKSSYIKGDFDNTLSVTYSKAPHDSSSTSNSALLWQLNHAAALRAAGFFDSANEAWEYAQPLFETAWENERLRLVRDALGLVIPATADSTYYAKPHEGIMLYTYRALDAMQAGDMDEARRFIIYAMHFRDEVIAENELRVEKRNATLQSGNHQGDPTDTTDLTRAALNNEFEKKEQTDDLKSLRGDSFAASDSLLAKVESNRIAADADFHSDLSGYKNYTNPFTAFLTYLFLRTQGTGLIQTDRNNVARELSDLLVFASRNRTIQAELKNPLNAPLQNTAYIIFETGLAPHLEEVRVEIPVPSKYISYIGMAYPQLRPNHNHVPTMTVTDYCGTRLHTELLADVDAMVKQIYDDTFPAVIARQIAQSVVNAAVNAALNLAARRATDNIKDANTRALAQLGTWITTAAISYASTSTDIRSWELLPKQFQLARITIPQDRKIGLSFPSGSWHNDLTLQDGEVIVVLVKSTGSMQAEPVVSQFKLK